MIRINRLGMSMICLLLAISLCACDKTATEESLYFPTKKDVAQSMDVSMKTFTSTQDLEEDASVIVVGKIISSDRQAKNGSVDYEISVLKIEQVIKGDLAVGETVNVQEPGERTEEGDISIGGAPLLYKNMRVLLYLNAPTTDTLDGETSYGITGCYLGKFYYDSKGMVHPATEIALEAVQELEDFKEAKSENVALNIVKDAVTE